MQARLQRPQPIGLPPTLRCRACEVWAEILMCEAPMQAGGQVVRQVNGRHRALADATRIKDEHVSLVKGLELIVFSGQAKK